MFRKSNENFKYPNLFFLKFFLKFYQNFAKFPSLKCDIRFVILCSKYFNCFFTSTFFLDLQRVQIVENAVSAESVTDLNVANIQNQYNFLSPFKKSPNLTYGVNLPRQHFRPTNPSPPNSREHNTKVIKF